MIRLSLLVLLALLALPRQADAQPRPVRAAVAAVVPGPALSGAVVVHHRGVPYRHVRGVFYRPVRGGYVVTPPPSGLAVSRLPQGARAFQHRGVRHYRLNGVVYRPARHGYVVVRL